MKNCILSIALICFSHLGLCQSEVFKFHQNNQDQSNTERSEIQNEFDQLKQMILLLAPNEDVGTKLLDTDAQIAESEQTASEPAKLDLDALPEVLSPFTSAVVIPSITLSLTRAKLDSANSIHAFDVYIAKASSLTADSTLTSTSVRNRLSQSLWIPESGSFYFRYGYSRLLGKKMAVGGAFYYRNVEIPTRELLNTGDFDKVTNIGLGHFQVNARIFLPDTDKKVLASFYANYNYQFAIDGVSQYKDYFGLDNNRARKYFTAGIEVSLGQQSKQLGAYIDLGFIIQTGDVDDIIGNDDLAIPVLKLKLNPNYENLFK